MDEESALINEKPDNTLAFRAAVSQMIENIAESVGEEMFGASQTFLKSQISDSKFPVIIRKLHKNFIDDIKSTMNEELNTIMANEDFIEGLGKVKNLMAEATSDPNHRAWRPPGDVELHLRTPDATKIDEETNTITNLVEELENENQCLKNEIIQIRKKITTINQQIKNSTNLATSSSFAQMENNQQHLQKCMDDLSKAEI